MTEHLARIEAQLDTIIANQVTGLSRTEVLIELHHEILDRPPPQVRHVLTIPAWSAKQIDKAARVLIAVMQKVMRGQ